VLGITDRLQDGQVIATQVQKLHVQEIWDLSRPNAMQTSLSRMNPCNSASKEKWLRRVAVELPFRVFVLHVAPETKIWSMCNLHVQGTRETKTELKRARRSLLPGERGQGCKRCQGPRSTIERVWGRASKVVAMLFFCVCSDRVQLQGIVEAEDSLEDRSREVDHVGTLDTWGRSDLRRSIETR
jgi:hypothetical protein